MRVFWLGFFCNVLLALAAEYPVRNRRVNSVWDECHQIPICRWDGLMLLCMESPLQSYSDISFPVRAACLSTLKVQLKMYNIFVGRFSKNDWLNKKSSLKYLVLPALHKSDRAWAPGLCWDVFTCLRSGSCQMRALKQAETVAQTPGGSTCIHVQPWSAVALHAERCLCDPLVKQAVIFKFRNRVFPDTASPVLYLLSMSLLRLPPVLLFRFCHGFHS